MSATFDTIYPDFLRTGLDRLRELGVQRELLALFSALEHFRCDLQAQENVAGVLTITHRYVAGLGLFRVAGFYLVNPEDHGFELEFCHPFGAKDALARCVDGEIQAGRFAWALRQTAPVFFQGNDAAGSERGVFHTLAVADQVLGMFCGLLQPGPATAQEITVSLLSVILGSCSDALASLRKTALLKTEVSTLTGLLPICAWCKKVRDDKGYWEQIEQYVSTRSEASFSHGICPACKEKYFGGAKRK